MIQKKFSHTLTLIILSLIILSTSCSKKSIPEVTLSVWGSEMDQELLENMCNSFSQHYSNQAKISITVCSEPESTCKDTVLLSPQAAADVYIFVDDQFSALVQKGALLPVTLNKEKVIESYGGNNSSAVVTASYDDTLYAYPLTASNGYFLYYNSDYLTEEDVLSIERILEVCKNNNKYFAMEFASGWYLYSFFKALGFDVVRNEDGQTSTCNWNSQIDGISGVDVTQALLNLVENDYFSDIGNEMFISGVQDNHIIAGISGTWNAAIVEEAFGKGYQATKLPTYRVKGKDFQMHSVVGYKMVGVNAYTKYPDWSQLLAQWFISEENQLLRFRERKEGPANKKAAENKEVLESKAIAALTKQAEFGHLQIVGDKYWNATYRFGNILSSGNIGNTDLQLLLDNLVNEISGGSNEK